MPDARAFVRKSGRGAQYCPCQCHWDMSWLVFEGTRIAAGDVDALFVVERSGRFLFLETKGTSEDLTPGQRIMLRALSCVPGFTVLVLYGERSIPVALVEISKGKELPKKPTTRDDVQLRVKQWFYVANAQDKTWWPA